MRVAAVANCETADRFVNSASPRAAPPKSFTCFLWPETLQAGRHAGIGRWRGGAGAGAEFGVGDGDGEAEVGGKGPGLRIQIGSKL